MSTIDDIIDGRVRHWLREFGYIDKDNKIVMNVTESNKEKIDINLKVAIFSDLTTEEKLHLKKNTKIKEGFLVESLIDRTIDSIIDSKVRNTLVKSNYIEKDNKIMAYVDVTDYMDEFQKIYDSVKKEFTGNKIKTVFQNELKDYQSGYILEIKTTKLRENITVLAFIMLVFTTEEFNYLKKKYRSKEISITEALIDRNVIFDYDYEDIWEIVSSK